MAVRSAATRDGRNPTPGVRGFGVRRFVGDGALAQLIRFALVGGASNILYIGAFALAGLWGTSVANLIGVVISSAAANELHRRLTFRAADRVGWVAAQFEGGTLALVALAMSSVTLFVLHRALPGLGGIDQALLVIAVSGIAGLVRFVALRGWVFGRTLAR
ncbi:GtrA family protein [Rhodococcus sp. D2-41]|uniref:GtrA family protein n=1 Tax=Speluncibacter jeojiensis TaxID=2710754 RepID=A0A9X4M1D5_9ACTN|nr:GtrA family protein [Rhodococcus sp. D2-41]MDG3010053.1 GtrA family protein [Rhodococcus sp. D2-41]MDG3016243.1 GtrA family protein [Corynebacteriales bacterium D3-21]